MNRFFKGALLAAAVAVAMVPANVFAEGGPYATFEIKVNPNPSVSNLSPAIVEPITKDQVSFHIINNTGKALFFNGNDGQYIPLVSNNTVTVPYKAGEAYKVVDADGATVAEWDLNGRMEGQVPNVSSASKEQFAAWGSTLQQVIENQKVAYQEPAAKPEPRYYESRSSRSASSGTTVRGYW